VASTVTRFTPYSELPEWLSVEEFMALWDCSRTAAYDLVRQQKIPSQRYGNLIRIPKTAVRPPEDA
jgi:excisionase family DNA binding protein